MIGGLYRHYKGETYILLHYGEDSNNDRNKERTVVYMSLDDPRKGIVYTRHAKEFFEDIKTCNDTWVPRFTYIGDPS